MKFNFLLLKYDLLDLFQFLKFYILFPIMAVWMLSGAGLLIAALLIPTASWASIIIVVIDAILLIQYVYRRYIKI